MRRMCWEKGCWNDEYRDLRCYKHFWTEKRIADAKKHGCPYPPYDRLSPWERQMGSIELFSTTKLPRDRNE